MASVRGARVFRWLAPAAALALLGGVAFAAMASNTVPDSNAGQGEGAISGYTVYNVHYAFDHTPKTLNSVSFLIRPVPQVVKVWFGSGTGQVYYDDNRAGQSSHCGLADIGGGVASVNCNSLVEPIDAVDSLHVSASQ